MGEKTLLMLQRKRRDLVVDFPALLGKAQHGLALVVTRRAAFDMAFLQQSGDTPSPIAETVAALQRLSA